MVEQRIKDMGLTKYADLPGGYSGGNKRKL